MFYAVLDIAIIVAATGLAWSTLRFWGGARRNALALVAATTSGIIAAAISLAAAPLLGLTHISAGPVFDYSGLQLGLGGGVHWFRAGWLLLVFLVLLNAGELLALAAWRAGAQLSEVAPSGPGCLTWALPVTWLAELVASTAGQTHGKPVIHGYFFGQCVRNCGEQADYAYVLLMGGIVAGLLSFLIFGVHVLNRLRDGKAVRPVTMALTIGTVAALLSVIGRLWALAVRVDVFSAAATAGLVESIGFVALAFGVARAFSPQWAPGPESADHLLPPTKTPQET